MDLEQEQEQTDNKRTVLNNPPRKEREPVDEETGQPVEVRFDAQRHREEFKLTQTQADLDKFLQPSDDAAKLERSFQITLPGPHPVKNILWHIAYTGHIEPFSWSSIQELFWTRFVGLLRLFVKFSDVDIDMEQWENRDVKIQQVQEAFFQFHEPPFTLQRMAELLCHPFRYYKETNKFYDAFTKTILGITTMDKLSDFGEEQIIDNTFENPYLQQEWFDLTEHPQDTPSQPFSSSSSSSSSAAAYHNDPSLNPSSCPNGSTMDTSSSASSP